MMSQINYHCRYRACGLTLIEVLVAVVIGLLVIIGAIELFISNQRIYREQEMMGRLQESARFAMNTLLNDIQSAGHIGCPHRIADLVNNIRGPAGPVQLLDFDNPIEGLQDGGTNWLPSNTNIDNNVNILRGDAITVRYLTDIANNLNVAPMNDETAVVSVNANDLGLDVGEIIAVADCVSTDIFAITGLNSTATDTAIAHAQANPGGLNNASNRLSRAYPQGDLYRMIARRYFIGTDPNSQQPALRVQQYVPDANGNYAIRVQTLVDGVEHMQVRYGERAASQFTNAAGVTDWSDVFAVRVALLFRTIGQDTSFPVDTTTYTLLGENPAYDPDDDQRHRRVFAATALIRNSNRQ